MKFALLTASVSAIRIEQAPVAPAPPAPWYQAQANKNIKKSADMAAFENAARVAAVNDVAAENAWRANGKVTPWGKLVQAQDQWQPWQTDELKKQQAYTMGVAAQSEKERVAAVNAVAAENVWRDNGPKTAWGKLAQRDWQPWQQTEFDNQNAHTLGVASEANAARNAAISAQGVSDEWRNNGPKRKWGQLAQKQWQEWQTEELDAQHKYTMGVAAQSEKERVAAVKAVAAENAWRDDGPKTAWGKLVQIEGDDEPVAPWYQKEADKLHAHTMVRAGEVNTFTNDAVTAEEKSNVWRGKGPVSTWGASNPQGWNEPKKAAAEKPKSSAPAKAPEVVAKESAAAAPKDAAAAAAAPKDAAAAPAAPADAAAAPAAPADAAAPAAPADAAAPAAPAK